METRPNLNTALLVMDLQTSILSRVGEPQRKTLTGQVQQAIAGARKAGMPVIYVVVGFRKGHPEISFSNKRFTAAKQNPAVIAGMEEPLVIAPEIAPGPGEVVVTKRRVSAFTGSDLEVILRAYKVQHLVLAGLSTSGVVLSTLLEAPDKDFQLTVISDCCADPDPELHTVLLTKVFPRQADVLTVEQWIAAS